MKQLISILILALLFAACERPAKHTIEIVAQDSEGKPIAHARVYLQGSYGGETNENGIFLKDTAIAGDISLGVIVHDPATNAKVPRTLFIRTNTPGVIRDTVLFAGPVKNASVTIRSDPSGATVFFNDLNRGQTPLSEKIPFGRYKVRVVSPDGKREIDSTLVLEEATLEIDLTLPPPPVPTSILEISSKPEGAIVYLDEHQVGRTPISKQVKFGKHHLRVVHDNGARLVEEWLTLNKEKVTRSYSFPDPVAGIRIEEEKAKGEIAQQFDLAQSAFGTKRWKDAEQGFSDVLAKKEYYASAYFYRGLARFQQKKYQDALKDFERTLEFRDQILPGERDKLIQLLEYYRAMVYKNLYESEENEDRRKLYREQAIYEFESYLKDFGTRAEYKDFIANADLFLRELKEAEE
jgi:hypothetical protein